MDKDRLMGVGILAGCIIAAIAYFGFALLGYSEEVVMAVVSMGFIGVLGIGGWIGWTMASTPSPEPVGDLDLEKDFEEEESVEVSEEIEEGAEKRREEG